MRRSIVIILFFAFAYAGYVQLIPSVPHVQVSPSTNIQPVRSAMPMAGSNTKGSGINDVGTDGML